MNGKCFEIGAIQAFLDGETTSEMSLRLTDHVAACDNCARLMADADEENAIVFSTLERELNTLVPTQRLWSRINATIEVEKGRMPIWQKVLVYVRLALANPSLTAAAGILLVLGMFAVVITVQDNAVKDVADNTRKVGQPARPAPVENASETPSIGETKASNTTEPAPVLTAVSYSSGRPRSWPYSCANTDSPPFSGCIV